jgi:hypothetical protein
MYPSMVDMDAVVLNRQLQFDSVAARRRFAIAGASPKEQRGGRVFAFASEAIRRVSGVFFGTAGPVSPASASGR